MELSVPSWVIPGTYGENLVFLADKPEITGMVYGFFFNCPRVLAVPLPSFSLFGLPLLSPLISRIIARQYQKHLGGYSGDALGAAVELGELLHLGGALGLLTILDI